MVLWRRGVGLRVMVREVWRRAWHSEMIVGVLGPNKA